MCRQGARVRVSCVEMHRFRHEPSGLSIGKKEKRIRQRYFKHKSIFDAIYAPEVDWRVIEWTNVHQWFPGDTVSYLRRECLQRISNFDWFLLHSRCTIGLELRCTIEMSTRLRWDLTRSSALIDSYSALLTHQFSLECTQHPPIVFPYVPNALSRNRWFLINQLSDVVCTCVNLIQISLICESRSQLHDTPCQISPLTLVLHWFWRF